MSYLVLARKWRPQTFADVIGQKPITQALQNAIATQRVAHALLFAGPRGVGKTSVARILAKALNCQESQNGQPCDRCTSCQEIREGIAVDVLEVDGASNRGIDEIRELRENVRYLPSKNRYKVYIIDEVHMLTDQAFNALLKTLEEPPPHVIFIFATTEAQKIPLTILSRCQRYDFKRIPAPALCEHLKMIVTREGVEISDSSLHLIAREAGGSMRDGQSLLDQILSFSGPKVKDQEVIEVLGVIDRKVLHDAIAALADGDRMRLLQIIEEVDSFGYDLKGFCEELARLLRDLLVLKIAPPGEAEGGRLVDLPAEEIRELVVQSEKLHPEEIYRLFRALLAAHDEVVRSAFPRLVLEMTLTRIARKEPILPVGEVVEKLQALERRLAAFGALGSSEAVFEPPSPPADRSVRESPGPPIFKGDEEPREESIAPETPAAAIPGPGMAVNGPWGELVGFVKKKKPGLASILGHGTPLVLQEDCWEIGYPEKSFYLERMQEPETLSLLQTLCSEFFRKTMRVRIIAMKPSVSGGGPGNGGEANGNQSRRTRDEETLNHPLVKEAIDVFGGRVVEIKG